LDLLAFVLTMEFLVFVALVWCIAMGLGFVLGRLSVRGAASAATPSAAAVPTIAPATAAGPAMQTWSALAQIVKKQEAR
jgi:hypothetical protein